VADSSIAGSALAGHLDDWMYHLTRRAVRRLFNHSGDVLSLSLVTGQEAGSAYTMWWLETSTDDVIWTWAQLLLEQDRAAALP
jgi:hypothetical protein